MKFEGMAIDHILRLKQAKQEIQTIRSKRQREVHDLPDWILRIKKIKDLDKAIQEQSSLTSLRNSTGHPESKRFDQGKGAIR